MFFIWVCVAFFRVIAGNCLGRDLILVPPHTPFQPSKHGWFSQVLACGASFGMCNHFRHAPLTLPLCRLYVLVHMNRLRTTNRIFFVCFQTASCYCCYFVALRCFEDQEFDSLFMLVWMPVHPVHFCRLRLTVVDHRMRWYNEDRQRPRFLKQASR